jgi:nitrous oxide reductase accessory protein NosL
MDDLSDALTAVELAARDGGRVVNTLGEILARLVARTSHGSEHHDHRQQAG